MELKVSERLIISQFLPEESSLTDQITSMDILRKTRLSREEKEKAFVPVQGGYVVGEDNDFEKEISFDKSEIEMLKDGFRKLDEKKKFTQANVSLALKIRDLQVPTFSEDTKEKLKKK